MPADPDPILRVEPVVRRVVSARVSNPDDADDLIQETLTRLYEAQSRLELRTLGSYAVVTARNLVASLHRRREAAERLAPKAYEPRFAVDPEEQALRREEHQALITALTHLEHDERQALIERDVFGVPTRSIARARSISRGATATRLARNRARLRVEFLLAFRGLRLPTEKCRGVLDSLAAGDRARQKELGAGEHIEQCAPCASLVEPLTKRSRRLAALLPVAWAMRQTRRVWKGVRDRPALSTAGPVAAIAVVVAVLIAQNDDPSPRRNNNVATAVLMIGGEKALPLPPRFSWDSHAGDIAVARQAPVESVPSDEGFWLGTTNRDRLFVMIKTTDESRTTVKVSDDVSFTGRLVGNERIQLQQVGLTRAEGLAQLQSQGYHIEVSSTRLQTNQP